MELVRNKAKYRRHFHFTTFRERRRETNLLNFLDQAFVAALVPNVVLASALSV